MNTLRKDCTLIGDHSNVVIRATFSQNYWFDWCVNDCFYILMGFWLFCVVCLAFDNTRMYVCTYPIGNI